MTAPPPVISGERLWGHLMELASFTESGVPWTRRAFTPEYAAGRDWLTARFRAAGLATRCDAAGNLIGRREGRSAGAGTLMIGSHSDTVRGGGRFDGIAGVSAALEIASALHESGVVLEHALEVVDFLAEEPNPYGVSCIGSRGMSGQLTQGMLERTDATGIPLQQRLVEAGAGAQPLASAKRSDIRAFLELHIEQGPVLDADGVDLGIVTAIAGIRRWEFCFRGQAAHAGTTPYPLRRDALQAAAQFIGEVPLAIEQLLAVCDEGAARPLLIATVGQLEITPNAANVVPASARLAVDIRSDSPALLISATARLESLARAIAAGRRVTLEQARELSASEPATCDPRLRNSLLEAARTRGSSTREMVSGAGHDAAFIALVAPAAMLFVPSRDGLSHTAEEWTDAAQLARGTQVLFDAVLAADRSGP